MQVQQSSLCGLGSTALPAQTGFSQRPGSPIRLHTIVIPSGVGRFLFSLCSCEASACAVEESAFVPASPLVAQASACVPFNSATLYPFAENLPVDVLSSKGKKI
jgi:hypothetical protein